MTRAGIPVLVVSLVLGASAAADVEERRLAKARAVLPDVVDRYAHVIDVLDADAGLPDQAVRAAGQALWRAAVDDDGPRDDRALYWARLALRDAVQRAWPQTPALIAIAEHASRGLDDIRFPDEGQLRVFVTGFDPFNLDAEIRQSNPSGFAALALDGAELPVGGRAARIESVLVPVRFADFDGGLVETLMAPLLVGPEVDLVVTISMGRDAFDLERFPGLRRSAEVPDNEGVLTGASPASPRAPMLGQIALSGPEFVEFRLPGEQMAGSAGRWPVRDNRQVQTLERGVFEARSLADLAGQTAVAGSGGGYLSNEIAYRSLRLAEAVGSRVPVGHLHTPAVVGYDHALESEMLAAIREILGRCRT